MEGAGVEEEGDEFGFLETLEVGAFFGGGRAGWGGGFAGEVGSLGAGGGAVGAEPFFLFDLDDGGGDGAVVAVLVPGDVAAVAEDDLVGFGGVASAAVYAHGCFARFASFGFGFFGGWGGFCSCCWGVEDWSF